MADGARRAGDFVRQFEQFSHRSDFPGAVADRADSAKGALQRIDAPVKLGIVGVFQGLKFVGESIFVSGHGVGPKFRGFDRAAPSDRRAWQ